jgi:hypothetical protein
MKKILLIPFLFFCFSAKAQLFDPNPKELFQKNNLSISLFGAPTFQFVYGNINKDSIPKVKGVSIGSSITYYPIDYFSISILVNYFQNKNILFDRIIFQEKEIVIYPYFSFLPFGYKKLSFDLGWHIGYKNEFSSITDSSSVFLENGLGYGLSFHHIFKKNIGFLNNHLGVQVIYHKIFSFKKITTESPEFKTLMHFALIYHF